MFGHSFELLIVLLLGLLIFGPKRVIEMGSAAGKMLRELRDAVKDMNWTTLSGDEHGSDPIAELRDLPRTFASSILNPPPMPATPQAPTATTPPPAVPADTLASASQAAPIVESAPAQVHDGSMPAASTPTEPAE